MWAFFLNPFAFIFLLKYNASISVSFENNKELGKLTLPLSS